MVIPVFVKTTFDIASALSTLYSDFAKQKEMAVVTIERSIDGFNVVKGEYEGYLPLINQRIQVVKSLNNIGTVLEQEGFPPTAFYSGDAKVDGDAIVSGLSLFDLKFLLLKLENIVNNIYKNYPDYIKIKPSYPHICSLMGISEPVVPTETEITKEDIIWNLETNRITI
jgi:hypothetical protein